MLANFELILLSVCVKFNLRMRYTTIAIEDTENLEISYTKLKACMHGLGGGPEKEVAMIRRPLLYCMAH